MIMLKNNGTLLSNDLFKYGINCNTEYMWQRLSNIVSTHIKKISKSNLKQNILIFFKIIDENDGEFARMD